ncbi:MAG: hypothetical protein IKA36_01865 [Clostridia bacterium]|nr:hypothetical protein [Clostridia bacterium]
MFENFIEKKSINRCLTQEEYYEIVDYMLKNKIDVEVSKMFLALNTFGMNKKEVLSLAIAIRDSGKVLKYNQNILEKHSTGGVADSTSVVLIPLLASLGYKIIKTTARSLVFTNGSADRFGAIPNLKVKLTNNEIEKALAKTNACILSHKGDMCPADQILFDVIEKHELHNDINLLAASIIAKKLASGAKSVLIDVKYGRNALVKSYLKALKMAKIMKYAFKQCGVKSTILVTSSYQPIGDSIGNSLEMLDAIDVLHGKRCFLRETAIDYAVEMMKLAGAKMDNFDMRHLLATSLDNGRAWDKFVDIVKIQGGDVTAIKKDSYFAPYNTSVIKSNFDGYVESIDVMSIGEIVRKLCKVSHDNNIGVTLNVKVGDKVSVGDEVATFYYKNKKDFKDYKDVIANCIRLTDVKVNKKPIIKKVIR